MEVVADFGAADHVGTCLIFNCPGGFRLVVGVVWGTDTGEGALYIKGFFTHAEYDRGGWKAGCGC